MPENHNSDNEGEERKQPPAPNYSQPVCNTAQRRPDKTEQHPHWADRIVAVFTVLIFLTYITSNIVLWRQLKVTQEQMRITAAQLKLSQDELELSHRPWVSIKAVIRSPLT